MAKKNPTKVYDDFGRRDEVLDFVADELCRLIKLWPTYRRLGMEGELKRMIRYLTGAYVAPRSDTEDVLRSEKANERLQASNSAKGLVYDHVVPLEDLFKKLAPNENEKDAAPKFTKEDISTLLRKTFFMVMITKKEDESLSSSGFRSKMPKGCDWAKDPFARYKHKNCKIKVFNGNGKRIRTSRLGV